MCSEETILTMFDTLWFEEGLLFTSNPNSFPAPKTPPVLQEEDHEPKLNRITSTIMRKSYSDQFLSSKSSMDSSPSPKSVLGPHLQTILSGKEVESFDDSSIISPKLEQIHISKPGFSRKADGRKRRRRSRRRSGSKSLSELEMEELKGFMDLGFVFSDEEKEDSRLVSIIPGLQIRQNMQDSDINGFADLSLFRRPYLSEAWDCLEDEDTLTNPTFISDLTGNDDIAIKDYIRFWAHTVASAVR